MTNYDMWPTLIPTQHVPNGNCSIERPCQSSIVLHPKKNAPSFLVTWVVACCFESMFGSLRNPSRHHVFENKYVVEPMYS